MRNCHYSHIACGRRAASGQALLLAVVVMVLLSLIGAALVSVVSVNLSQTARQQDVVAAENQAKAGIEYADKQLTNSADGADWRPQGAPHAHTPPGGTSTVDTNPPAQYVNGSTVVAQDPDFDRYYDEIEQARGWFSTRSATAPYQYIRRVVKLPDPMSPTPTSLTNTDFAGGRFLLSVDYDPVAGNPLSKYIIIQSTGRSTDNPSVFRTMVAYKPIGITDYAEFVTDYDSTSDSVPTPTATGDFAAGMADQINFDGDGPTKLSAAASAGASTIRVPRTAAFPAGTSAGPQYIRIDRGGANDESGLQVTASRVAFGVSYRELTLNTPLAKAHGANEIVERTDASGTPLTENNDGDEDLAASDSPQLTVTGPVRLQGNVQWYGNLLFNLLTSASDPLRDDKVEVAGSLVTQTIAGANPATVNVKVDGGASTAVADTSASGTFSSLNGRYIDNYGVANTSAPDASQRWVQSVKAPVVATEVGPSPGRGTIQSPRYDELTRLSNSQTPAGATATYGELGYGNGYFINNSADRQFTTTTYPSTPAGIRTRMNAYVTEWQTPNPGTANSSWTNQYDYEPPGVEIYLTASDVLPDGTSLSTATSHGGFTSNGNSFLNSGAPHTPGYPIIWIRRNGSGAPNAGTPLAYRYDGTTAMTEYANPAHPNVADPLHRFTVYTVDYPANGVIYCPGNVRIHGVLPKSYLAVDGTTAVARAFNLTVVSGRTIYIEGSILRPVDWDANTLVANNSQIALLAKDHICVNTTQFQQPSIAYPGDTIAAEPVPGAGSAPDVQPASGGQSDDFYRLDNTSAGQTLVRDVTYGAANGLGGSDLVRINLRHSGTRTLALTMKNVSGASHSLAVNWDANSNGKIDAASAGPPVVAGEHQLQVSASTTSSPYDLTNPLYSTPTLLKTRFNLTAPPPNGPEPDWDIDLTGATNSGHPAQNMATIGGPGAFPAGAKSVPAGSGYPVLWTTHVGLWLNDPAVTTGQQLFWFGSDADPTMSRNEIFYLDSQNQTLQAPPMLESVSPTSVVTSATPASGQLSTYVGLANELRLHFDTTSNQGDAAYRLTGVRVEHRFSAGGGQYHAGPGPVIKISALCYAQDGTFFVIPGGYFDDSAVNYDTNGNGTIEPNEEYAIEFRRYNYPIQITGAVAENYIQSPAGVADTSALWCTEWNEKWSYPQYVADVPGSSPATAGYQWNPVQIAYDTRLRRQRDAGTAGPFITLPALPKLPVSSSLVYVNTAA